MRHIKDGFGPTMWYVSYGMILPLGDLRALSSVVAEEAEINLVFQVGHAVCSPLKVSLLDQVLGDMKLLWYDYMDDAGYMETGT